jgi:arylsulfatase A-like enzyme
MIALWEGTLERGRVITELVSLLDLVPTAIEVTGAAEPPDGVLDGISLATLLRGDAKTIGRKDLFWRHGTNWAMRHGDWKLIGFAGRDQPLLFDLSSEDGETRDLAFLRPVQVAALTRLYREWEAKTVAPLWDSGGSIWIALDEVMAGKPMRPLAGPQPGAVAIP